MRTIEVGRIELGDRQRKYINNQQVLELAESIRTKGLLHPIVCVELEENLKLVAGERRLRAIKSLAEEELLFSCDGEKVPLGHTPFILLTDLDDIELREAELEENTIRIDLTWQERVAATDELHRLRKARNPKQTKADTAMEMSGEKITERHARRLVSQSIIVAKFLDDPDVQKSKNISQAYQLATRKIETSMRAELARRGEDYATHHELIAGDLHIEMPKLKEIACIIADPPYGIQADNFGDQASHTHQYTDDAATALSIAESILSIGFNITQANAHIYMFCDIDHFVSLRIVADKLGWTPFRTPLIWHKRSARGHAPIHTRGFRRTYELILFASKGDKPFSQVSEDIIEESTVHELEVAAQKPPALYKSLLGKSCLPGDKILDPCCGSGTIFLAAEQLNLTAIGIEQEPGALEIAQVALASMHTEAEVEEGE